MSAAVSRDVVKDLSDEAADLLGPDFDDHFNTPTLPPFAHRMDSPHAYAAMRRLAREVHFGKATLFDVWRWAKRWAIAQHRCNQVDVFGASMRLVHYAREEIDALDLLATQVSKDIANLIKPLLVAGAKSNQLLAEAHTVNGDAGFPLTEAAVTDVVRAGVYWAAHGQQRVARS